MTVDSQPSHRKPSLLPTRAPTVTEGSPQTVPKPLCRVYPTQSRDGNGAVARASATAPLTERLRGSRRPLRYRRGSA